jgi:hypothetical protein
VGDLTVGTVRGRQGPWSSDPVKDDDYVFMDEWPAPQIIYGAQPVWDQSLTSYAEVQRITHLTSSQSWISSNFAIAPVTGVLDPAITELPWEMQVSATVEDTAAVAANVGVSLELFGPGLEPYLNTSVEGLIPLGGTVTTLQGVFDQSHLDDSFSEPTWADIADAIAAGTYEAWVSATGSPPEPAFSGYRRLIVRVYSLTLGGAVDVPPFPAIPYGGIDGSNEGVRQEFWGPR